MIASGMPSVKWGKRIRRIQPSKAIAWIRQQDRGAEESSSNQPLRP
jgi:hypothetical protein